MEAKNVREWIYPSSAKIWPMVRKCLAVDAVPLLVTREAAYITTVLFQRLGMFVFEVHRQLFSPRVAGYLAAIRHTDELGYKDVLVWDESQPNPHLLTFLRKSVPSALAATVNQWNAQKWLLELFAARLAERIDDTTRERRYRELSRVIFPRPVPSPPDHPIEDDPELWRA